MSNTVTRWTTWCLCGRCLTFALARVIERALLVTQNYGIVLRIKVLHYEAIDGRDALYHVNQSCGTHEMILQMNRNELQDTGEGVDQVTIKLREADIAHRIVVPSPAAAAEAAAAAAAAAATTTTTTASWQAESATEADVTAPDDDDEIESE